MMPVTLGRAAWAFVCALTGPSGLTRPAISNRLKVLAGAGNFSRDKRGVRVCYALHLAALRALACRPGRAARLAGRPVLRAAALRWPGVAG